MVRYGKLPGERQGATFSSFANGANDLYSRSMELAFLIQMFIVMFLMPVKLPLPSKSPKESV